MAQVMMLIGLLLLAYLVRSAFLFLAQRRGQRSDGGFADQGVRADLPQPDDGEVAHLKQQRDDLEARVAVLERLLQSSTEPAALPLPSAGGDKAPPAS